MVNAKQLKVGSKLSETQFYSVSKIQGAEIELVDEQGTPITINKDYAEKCLISADQFSKEETVNKTTATELFASNPGVVMTVSYQKQVKEADVVAEIKTAYENSSPKEIEVSLKKAVKAALQGVERVLVGHHNGSQDGFGRYNMIDMNETKDPSKTYDTRLRLVDPRGINYLILKGVKYNVK